MKNSIKNGTLLIVAISALLTTFSSISSAVEIDNNQKQKVLFYDINAEEQSIVFKFLYYNAFLELAVDTLKKMDLCDFCEYADQSGVEYSRETPEKYIQCDHCLMFEETTLLKHLCGVLIAQSEEIFNKEINDILKNGNEANIEEVKKIISKAINFKNFKTDVEFKAFLKTLYNQVEAIGNFPSVLDKISLLGTVRNDFLEFIESSDDEQRIGRYLFVLMEYRKFLKNNYVCLSQIEGLDENNFVVRKCAGDNCKSEQIKSLSEIAIEVERLSESQELPDEILKDIL